MFFLCTIYPNRSNELMIKQCDGKFILCWIEWKNKMPNWNVTEVQNGFSISYKGERRLTWCEVIAFKFFL